MTEINPEIRKAVDAAYGRMNTNIQQRIDKATDALELKRLSEATVGKLLQAGTITEAEARARFSAMGYPTEDVNLLIGMLGTSTTAPTATIKKLSEGNIGKLLKAGQMTEADARTRFSAMGYPDEDVDYLILIYSP